jgi:glyoxylase-like metal-dependent hydrolase (beta-lactamase superfamily II)
MRHSIHTLDLGFQGFANVIAAYLIPHTRGAVLIETGPGSTIPALVAALREFHLTPGDITDVLLTHIHLDHAGAAGWLAREGAKIHVHPNGAPHLISPEKLIKSATRIYGEKMDSLWGAFLPVPEERVVTLEDQQEIRIEELRFTALDTPGHAEHHFCYLLDDVCFSGDVGGVRLPGLPHLRVPMPPPEFHPEKWRASLAKLSDAGFARIAPTHFGVFDNAKEHLFLLGEALDEVEEFLEELMPSDPSVEEIDERFREWTRKRAEAQGLDEGAMRAYEAANPTWMSAAGMQRYWKKCRATL